MDNVLSLLGKVDAAGVGLPQSFEKGAAGASRAVAGLAAGLQKAAGVQIAPAVQKQNRALTEQAAAFTKAAAAYGKYQTNLARKTADPTSITRLGGLQPQRQSNAALATLSTQGASLAANGVSLGSGGRALLTAINQEIAARARAKSAAAGYAAAVKSAEAEATAAVEQQVQRRVAAGQHEIAAADAYAAQQRARRYATVPSASSNRLAPEQRVEAQANGGGALALALAREEQQTAGVAAATLKANTANDRFQAGLRQAYQRNLPQTAYALTSVSRSAAVAGGALIAAGAAPIAVAANYQDLYAQVERTSEILTNPGTQAQKDQQFGILRQDLVDLSKQIPVTFADITKIATLGNQLGIPNADIANFTKTVAEFSATTDVPVEDAAESFGRLGELLNNTDFKQIGDQIAYLGVKSVATESDIIKTTTQLAVSLQSLNTLPQNGSTSSLNQIKETTAATLALSTTVAGLGVKPEQARGTFIRTFGAIGKAVADGGAQLNDLARISGTTSAGFAANWNAGGSKAYTQFLAFTKGLGSNTAEINANLGSLGIRAVRDRQTLGLLQQNPDRAQKDFTNAQVGGKNNFLDKAFEVQSQTAVKQLQVLGQQVLALFDDIGKEATGPLTLALRALRSVVGFLDAIEKNKFAATFIAAGAVLSVLTGVLLVGVGAVGKYASSLVYLQILLSDVQGGTGLLSSIYAGMTGNAVRAAGGTGVLTEALVAQGYAQDQASGAAGRAVAALEAESGAKGKTVLTTEALTAALVEQGIAQDAANGAATRTTATVSTTGGAFARTAGSASKLGGAIGKIGLVGSLIGLVLILPSVVTGINAIVNEIKGAVPQVDDLAKAVENLGNKQADLAAGTIQKGFQAFGTKNLPSALGQTTGTDPLAIPGFKGLGTPGFKQKNVISAGQAAVNTVNLGQVTAKGQTLGAGADVTTAVTELQNADAAIAQLFQGGNIKGANALLGLLKTAMKGAGVGTHDLELALTKTRAALGATGKESLAEATKNKIVADSAQDAADAQGAFNDSLNDLFDPTSAALKVTDDFKAIGTAVKESGAAVGLNGAEMKQAIEDIYASSSDLPTVKGRLQSVLDQLTAQGYTPDQLSGLSSAILGIAGDARKTKVDLSGFSDGLKGTADAAAAAKRTLVDYGSDLAATFSRSYEIRFGNQDALDKVTSGWRSLTSSISDSRDELRKAKADLAALKADRNVTEYQLGVAKQFGDTTRTAVLRAQLGQQDAAVKDKQKDVTKAATATNRTLVGNSDAAIANRAGLQGQIQSSAAYVQSIAANGGTQKQIQAAVASQKKQFIDNATAAGYSRKQVLKVAAAYDDMRTIVKQVPRNVSTSFHAKTGPAEKALAEYKQGLSSIDGKTVSTKVHLAFDPDAATSTFTVTQLPSAIATPAADAVKKALPSALTGKFREGGYTGDGPVWQAAGVVHGQEMVLNQRATQMFPRAMLEGANHGVAPVFPQVTATATIGSGATMSLGTTERRLLAAAGAGGALSIRGDRIAQAFDEEFRRANRRGQG